MWSLFTVGSLQFCNDSAIASLEANQNRPKPDQTNDHKHGIYRYVKLSTNLLEQAANKNTNFMFIKTGELLSLSMISEVFVHKNSKQTLPQFEIVTVQGFAIGFLTVTSNHWVSAKLLFLIKNIIWDGFY